MALLKQEALRYEYTGEGVLKYIDMPVSSLSESKIVQLEFDLKINGNRSMGLKRNKFVKSEKSHSSTSLFFLKPHQNSIFS